MKKDSIQNEFLATRRNLPHWQVGGSIYFVTFRTKKIELSPPARKVILKACRYFDGGISHRQDALGSHRQDACATTAHHYTLWAAVVMPDHVHMIVQPARKEDSWWALSDILHSIKSFTANKINKLLKEKRSFWQDESFDRIIRNEKEFLEKWNYIRNNPVTKGLCQRPEDWDGLYECKK